MYIDSLCKIDMKHVKIFVGCAVLLAMVMAYPVKAENTVPDGLLVKSKTDPKVYYIENNTKRPIESPEMLESRFDWDNLVITSRADLEGISDGSPMTFREGSLLSHGGTVYLVSDGKRRPFESAQAFLSLGFSWGNVREVSRPELDVHPQGAAIRVGDKHPDGVLLQSSKDAMYFLDNGKRRYIPSPLIFESQFRWEEAVRVSDGVLQSYPKGADMFYPDGLLIASATGVYIMDDNKKRPIAAPEIFESYGMSWNLVRRATDYEHSIIPKGSAFGQVRTYPNGTLIKADDSDTIYIFQSGKIREIPTPNVFASHGLSYDEVLTFPRRVVNRFSIGSKYRFRDGALIAHGGTVYLIEDGKRRAFQSAQVFEVLGYKWPDVVNVSREELELHPRGENVATVTSSNLNGYSLPATSGKTAREQHLAIDCNETAEEHYARAGILNASPSWLRNGLLNSGGAFAQRCPSGSRNFSAGNFSVEEEKYYITMRWNYVDWFEATSQLAQSMSPSSNQIVVQDASRFPSTGFVIINGEIIGYSGKSGNTLTVTTRGVDSPNIAASPKSHGTGSTVQEVYEYRPDTWRGRTRTALRSDTNASYNWHRGKRVLVTNPATGKSVVTAITESGPGIFTGRVSGLSPEAMHAIGAVVDSNLEYGFLIDQDTQLGPVN